METLLNNTIGEFYKLSTGESEKRKSRLTRVFKLRNGKKISIEVEQGQSEKTNQAKVYWRCIDDCEGYTDEEMRVKLESVAEQCCKEGIMGRVIEECDESEFIVEFNTCPPDSVLNMKILR